MEPNWNDKFTATSNKMKNYERNNSKNDFGTNSVSLTM